MAKNPKVETFDFCFRLANVKQFPSKRVVRTHQVLFNLYLLEEFFLKSVEAKMFHFEKTQNKNNIYYYIQAMKDASWFHLEVLTYFAKFTISNIAKKALFEALFHEVF